MYLDPQNLVNADPDPGQKNHQIDFKPSFKSQEKKNIFKSVPKTLRLATYLGSDLKKIFPTKKNKMLVG